MIASTQRRTASSTSSAGSWAIYARISQDRTGAGLAVERQIEDCRKLAPLLKLRGEPTVYTDNDISASSGKRRPAYERLLAALRAGKHSHLIVWHADRLHRRLIELEEFINIIEASAVRVHTVRSGELDLSTPTGRMQARIVGAVARHEVEQKGDRRRRAIEQQAARGEWHGGNRRFGYGRTTVGRDGKRHNTDIQKINRREAIAIRAAFDAILRGQSTTSIWKKWNRRGLLTQHGNPWEGTTFGNMLKRPSLAGLVTYKGEIQEGVTAQWPAIVPVEKWRAVQAIITDPARRTSPGNQPKHLCSGVVYCECGRPLRAGTNSIKSKRTGEAFPYTVYRCSTGERGHVTILKDPLDERVRHEIIDALYRRRERPATPRNEEDEAALIFLNQELGELGKAQDRLADAIVDGTVSRDRARARSAKIEARIKARTEERERIERRSALADAATAEWEEVWAGVDLSGQDQETIGNGQTAIHFGRIILRQMVAEGMTEDEARAKLALGARFDELSLEQQHALIKAHIRVTVRATGRGSRPKDRVAAEDLAG